MHFLFIFYLFMQTFSITTATSTTSLDSSTTSFDTSTTPSTNCTCSESLINIDKDNNSGVIFPQPDTLFICPNMHCNWTINLNTYNYTYILQLRFDYSYDLMNNITTTRFIVTNCDDRYVLFDSYQNPYYNYGSNMFSKYVYTQDSKICIYLYSSMEIYYYEGLYFDISYTLEEGPEFEVNLQ